MPNIDINETEIIDLYLNVKVNQIFLIEMEIGLRPNKAIHVM